MIKYKKKIIKKGQWSIKIDASNEFKSDVEWILFYSKSLAMIRLFLSLKENENVSKDKNSWIFTLKKNRIISFIKTKYKILLKRLIIKVQRP